MHACNAEDMCWLVQKTNTNILIYTCMVSAFIKKNLAKVSGKEAVKKIHKMQLYSLLLSKHDDINSGCAKRLNVCPGSDYFVLSTSWGT